MTRAAWLLAGFAAIGGTALAWRGPSPPVPPSTERFVEDFEHGLCIGACRGAHWALTQQIDGSVTVAAAPGGGHALLARAGPRTDRVAKADLVARIAPVREGGTIRVAFAMLIPAGMPADSLQLVDLECATCGEGGNPGIRLYLRHGRLRIDRSKIGIRHAWTNDAAPAIVPGRWHRIEWVTRIGGEDEGQARVTLDGREMLSAAGATAAYGAVDRVQIGITANSNPVPAQVWFDDIAVTLSR